MRLAPLILPLCLLTSCEKETPPTVRVPSSLRLEHFELPVSSFSKDLLASADSGYIEALVDGETLEIHHPNGTVSTTAAGQTYDAVLESISRSVPNQGEKPPLLISAAASTKFGTIRSVIRSAAREGIYRILFLVKSDAKGTGIIRFEIPTMDDELPKIDPFFIQIDDKDQIFSGAGASRARLDDDAENREPEKLNDILGLFSAAAKSAGYTEAPCQIYVNPEASYQRMIDVLSMLRKWNLKPYFIDMEDEPGPKVKLPSPRKPTAPYGTPPLPLAPPHE